MLRRRPRPLAATIVLTLAGCLTVLSACANNGEIDKADCAALIPNLQGCHIYSLEEAPETAPKLVRAAEVVTLKTEGHSLVVQTGCNTVNVSGDVVNGAFVSSDLAAGLKLCGPEASESEEWLSDFFSGTTAWAIDGNRVTITKGDSKLTFLS